MMLMNVLAFDTCWKACSAAIVQFSGDEPAVLAHCFESMSRGQAEALPVMLAKVFEHARLSAQDINRIAVPNGPGSFTGVRIGISAARALKLSTNADLVTCSSLHVMALSVGRSIEAEQQVEPGATNDILIAMDARRDEVYVQEFSLTSDGRECAAKTEPQLLPRSQAAMLGAADRLFVAGTGAEVIAGEAKKLGRDMTMIAHAGVPDALDLARCARRLVPLSEPLMPVYLRPPDAKPSTKPAIQRTTP